MELKKKKGIGKGVKVKAEAGGRGALDLEVVETRERDETRDCRYNSWGE